MSAVARGGGTRTTTARAPRAGCGCKPSGADGKSCSTKACGCAKEGKGCSEQCDCGGASGASAPRCHCGLVCQLKTVAKEGPNQGRRFFPCPKPRGEGCQFFEWVPPGRGCCANPFAAGARPGQRDGASAASASSGAGTSGQNLFDAIDLDASDGSDGPGVGSGWMGEGGGGRGRGRGRGVPGGSGGRGGSSRGGRGRGGGRRGKRKRCELGSACPFKDEHQHTSEYHHDEDDDGAEGGRGGRGGAGGWRADPFGGSGQKLGGGSFSGGGCGDGGDGQRCEVCGRAVGGGSAMELHMAKHERAGEVEAWVAARAREAEKQEQDRAYHESLLADQRAAEEEELREAIRASEEEAARAKERADAARREARRRASEELGAEPSADEAATTTIRVRLPDGRVVVRRFVRSSLARDLYAWLEGIADLDGWTSGDETSSPGASSWALVPPPSVALDGGLMRTDESLEELDLLNVTLSMLPAEAG